MKRNLRGLYAQSDEISQIIVVVRPNDVATRDVIESVGDELVQLVTKEVHEPGVIPALNVGLEAVRTDLVAFLDDDAVARPDWARRIRSTFDGNPVLGGLGGRDEIYLDGRAITEPTHSRVGVLQWYGRVIGNHHSGIGPTRSVDVLKGVNMAFRMAAVGRLRFDVRLRRRATYTHWELAFCLPLRRAGWELWYNPDLLVDHHVAARPSSDQRDRDVFDPETTRNATFNEVFTLLQHLSLPRKLCLLTWAILVGSRSSYGLVQMMRFAGRNCGVVDRFAAATHGKIEAVQAYLFAGRQDLARFTGLKPS